MADHGPPDDYRHEDDTVLSNFDHSIDRDLEQRLRTEKVVLQYAARDFCGEVWYDPQVSLFRCLVRVYGSPREMVSWPTLEEIMESVSSEYGYE